MTENFCPTLTGVLEYLMALRRESIRPPEAQARLRHLQTRYPDSSIDLVWEEEVYDRSVHYDALVHLDGQGTVSLSFCPDQALPWPLRGVGRWSDKDLVRRIHDLGEKMFFTGEVRRREACVRANYANAIAYFKERGLVVEKDKKLELAPAADARRTAAEIAELLPG